MSDESNGKVVGQLPPRGNINTEWDSVASFAQNHPNQAVEVAKDVSVVRINSIRQYVRREPYATEDGHIEVSLRGSKVHEDGVRRGTMYFTWRPASKRKR